jgi:hypothetical protein
LKLNQGEYVLGFFSTFHGGHSGVVHKDIDVAEDIPRLSCLRLDLFGTGCDVELKKLESLQLEMTQTLLDFAAGCNDSVPASNNMLDQSRPYARGSASDEPH